MTKGTSSRIVLISGKQGAGKTTLQKNLFRRWGSIPGQWAHWLNFADPLYKMHDFCRGIIQTGGIEVDQTKKDGRLLQLLGTEWGRQTIDPDIWIKILRSKVEAQLKNDNNSGSHLFLVGDCRFSNEFDAFPDALRIRLNCTREKRQERCESWRETDQHPSEIDLDTYMALGKFDLVLDTALLNEQDCTELVHAQIQKNNWMEKR